MSEMSYGGYNKMKREGSERGYYTTDMESESENGIEAEMNQKSNGAERVVTCCFSRQAN